MDECTTRSNLRFLAASTALISAMALFFLLVSWAVGGTDYYREVLLGHRLTPVLLGLMVIGAIIAGLLRDEPAGRIPAAASTAGPGPGR